MNIRMQQTVHQSKEVKHRRFHNLSEGEIPRRSHQMEKDAQITNAVHSSFENYLLF